MSRFYIDKNTGKLEKSGFCTLRLIKADGEVIEDLEARRCFPMADQDHYISLINSSERETAMIRDMAELDKESREAVTECLAEYYMIPKIHKIVHISDKLGTVFITVDTDRGRVTFSCKNCDTLINGTANPNQKLLRDSNDSRYEIPDYTALDEESKRKLFGYV